DLHFQLRLNKGFPLTLLISSIGYEKQEVLVENNQSPILIDLVPTSTLAQEVVVSASRSVQTKLSSPVTIEQISTKDVQNSPQINYMDMVQGLRGVDVTVSSLDRKSTRLNSSHVKISYAVFCLKKKMIEVKPRPKNDVERIS